MNSALTQDPEMQRLLAQQELLQNVILKYFIFYFNIQNKNNNKILFWYLQMKRIQSVCWDKCMQDGVDSRLSSRQESCLTYCADRFVDSVILLTNKFNQRLSGGHWWKLKFFRLLNNKNSLFMNSYFIEYILFLKNRSF